MRIAKIPCASLGESVEDRSNEDLTIRVEYAGGDADDGGRHAFLRSAVWQSGSETATNLPDDEEWLSTSRAAEMLGVTTKTLSNWRVLGIDPDGYVRTSRTTGAYPKASIIRFNAKRRQEGLKYTNPFRQITEGDHGAKVQAFHKQEQRTVNAEN